MQISQVMVWTTLNLVTRRVVLYRYFVSVVPILVSNYHCHLSYLNNFRYSCKKTSPPGQICLIFIILVFRTGWERPNVSSSSVPLRFEFSESNQVKLKFFLRHGWNDDRTCGPLAQPSERASSWDWLWVEL